MAFSDFQSVRDGTDLVAAARGGCAEALGSLLESARTHLLITARRELPSRYRGHLAASDLVQDAVADGHRDFHAFRGGSATEFIAWMRAVLRGSMIDSFRRHGRAKRRPAGILQRLSAVDSGDDALTEPAEDRPEHVAMRGEDAGLVHTALDTLAAHHRRVLWLRHWEGRSFAEIGAEMGRSAEAARKLWCRAFEDLERVLADDSQRGARPRGT